MKLKAVAAEDALRSLDSAITAALRSGADEEDVYRAVSAAYKKRTGSLLDIPRDSKSRCLSNRVYRLALLFCAIVVSVVHTATFRGQKFVQPTTFESNYIPESVEGLGNQIQTKERSSGSNFTVQTAMENINNLRKKTQRKDDEERLSGSSLGAQKTKKYTKALQNQTQTEEDNSLGVQIRMKNVKGLSGGSFDVKNMANQTYTQKKFTKKGNEEEDSLSGIEIKMRSVYTTRNRTQTEEEKEIEESFSGGNSTIQTWISQYNLEAISQFLQYSPANNLTVNTNKTENPCPLDAFFHDGCQKRAGGTVCIFPGAILKRVEDSKVGSEFNSFKVLNDTRFFPELYHLDFKCKTVLQENVRPPGLTANRWCANFSYYRTFYKSAFEIFAANNIIPFDLNVCCNTLVRNDYIRIIDFGKYKLDEDPEAVLLENKIMLESILDEVPELIEKSKKRDHCT